MPIFIDILENKVLGREYKRGRQEGLQEGELKGKLEGKLEGELKVLRRLIEKRFGAMPGWVEERLADQSAADLEELSVRVLDAQSIEDLLQ
jgi:predicted transposase YdaD